MCIYNKACPRLGHISIEKKISNNIICYRKRETTAENKQTNPIAGPGGYNTVIVTITIKYFV